MNAYCFPRLCPEFAVRSILGAARVPACWSWVCSWLARPTARRRWPGGRFTSVCASAVRYEHHLYDHCLHCGLCLGFGILLAADAGLLETLHGHAILRSHAWKYAVMRNAPNVENRSVMPSRPFSDWFALRAWRCRLTDPYWLAAHRKSFRALLAACRQKIKSLLLSEPPFILSSFGFTSHSESDRPKLDSGHAYIRRQQVTAAADRAHRGGGGDAAAAPKPHERTCARACKAHDPTFAALKLRCSA